MKINWFSPLPPAKTDIANYTLRLLPSLLELTEVELWTTNPEYDQSINQLTSVRVYNINDLPWKTIHQADINFYNIGNNREFHQSIWEISQQCPGIVILHDLKIQEFFCGIYQAKQDKAGYLKQLRDYYGPDAQKIGELFWQGEISGRFMIENFPLTPAALNQAKAVICHSHYAYRTLMERASSLVGYIPLPYSSSDRLTKTSPEFIQSSKTPYQLILFGFISTNRRLGTILDALAKFPQRLLFRLDIYGEIWDLPLIQQRIHDLELAEIITIRGFVPEADLEQALSQADLAFNLRYPTMGEASASQLRIWSHGLPSFVTPIGWYAELPENTVAYVRLDHEMEDIHYHLNNYLAHPETYQDIGKMGQQWLKEHHNPDSCAAAIVEFGSAVTQAPLYPTAQYWIDRTTTAMHGWYEDDYAKTELQGLAEAIHFLTEATTNQENP